VLLLRFFEAGGRVRRAISAIKKRAGPHEDAIREFRLTRAGLELGAPLEGFQGVLRGVPTYVGRSGPLLGGAVAAVSGPELAEDVRVLVLAPYGRDAALAAAMLREAGLDAQACPDLAALEREIGRGAGLAVVAEEALATGDAHALSARLTAQPPWSDLPFVLLTRRAGGPERNPAAMRAMELLGNVSFVERPFHPLTLTSAARAALRARRRQYEARSHLRDLEESAERLSAGQARLRAVYETLQAGIAEASLDGRFLDANEAFCRIVGYGRDELKALTYAAITHPDDLAADADAYRRLQTGEIASYRLEKRYIRKDGTPVWIDLSTSLVRDAAGRPLYGVGAVQDVSERKAAEARQELLLAELSHRVKNMLAVILAIASQTAARAVSTTAFVEAFRGRLGALAAAHDLLTATGWRSVSLADLARRTLAPHFATDGGRLALDLADDVPLGPALAQSLALAFHELATNAAKHGALSAPEGTVTLSAGLAPDGRELCVLWRERGGPPVRPPATRGFGTTLLGRALTHQHGGRVELEWPPQGLLCRMSLQLGETA
jgi:PAS domain S-box-containing protein